MEAANGIEMTQVGYMVEEKDLETEAQVEKINQSFKGRNWVRNLAEILIHSQIILQ